MRLLILLSLFLSGCVTTEVTQERLAKHYRSAVFAYGDTLRKWSGYWAYRVVYDRQDQYDRWHPVIERWMESIAREANIFLRRDDGANDYAVLVEIKNSEHSSTSKRTQYCTVSLTEHEGRKFFRMAIAAQIRDSALEACIPHEVVHVLAIYGHSIAITPTLLNAYDDHNLAREPQWYDIAVLRIHGDHRLKNKMTRGEAMPIVRQIIAERWEEFRAAELR